MYIHNSKEEKEEVYYHRTTYQNRRDAAIGFFIVSMTLYGLERFGSWLFDKCHSPEIIAKDPKLANDTDNIWNHLGYGFMGCVCIALIVFCLYLFYHLVIFLYKLCREIGHSIMDGNKQYI